MKIEPEDIDEEVLGWMADYSLGLTTALSREELLQSSRELLAEGTSEHTFRLYDLLRYVKESQRERWATFSETAEVLIPVDETPPEQTMNEYDAVLRRHLARTMREAK